MASPFKIFIAYSRQDSALLEELRKHLRPLERSGKVKIWYDGLIEPGAVWEADIRANLHSADLILPLVSADAIDSDYFYEKEVKDALDRHAAGTARVAPLILRPCKWNITPLKDLQALPKNGKPVTTWGDRDAAWNDAVDSIWHYVETREQQQEAEQQRQAEEARRNTEAEKQRLEALAQQQRKAEEQKRLEVQRRQQQEADQKAKAEKERQRLQALETQRLEKVRKQQEAEARRLQKGAKGFDWRIPLVAGALLLVVFIIWQTAGGDGTEKPEISENIVADTTAPKATPDNFPDSVQQQKPTNIERPPSTNVPSKNKTKPEKEPANPKPANNPTASKQAKKEYPKPKPAFTDPFADDMVRIAGGTFIIGCLPERDGICSGNELLHANEVKVASFSICRYEVTQAQWQEIMGNNPSTYKGCENCPVETVTWDDVQQFIDSINRKTGKRYRLPDETEWEFASRGGNKSKGYKYSGSNNIEEVAWYKNNSGGKTQLVGKKMKNEIGLYDMNGNVWELCTGNRNDTPKIGSDSMEVSSFRVVRGGSKVNDPNYCLSVSRSIYYKGFVGSGYGFRLAL